MKYSFLVPLLMTLGFFLIVDLYTWRAIRKAGKGKKWYPWLTGLHLVLLALAWFSFSYYFLSPAEQRYTSMRTYVSGTLFAFYVSKLIFLLFVLLEDIIAVIQSLYLRIKEMVKKREQKVTAEEVGSGMSRAKFLYAAGTLTAAVPFYVMTRGIYKNAYDYRVKHVPLYLPNLPKAFEGKTLLQISDVHSGSLSEKDKVYKGIKMVKELNPDIFFFTGDIVNNFHWEMSDFVEMFSEMKGKMGTFSSLGNHDYGLYHKWESEQDKQKNFLDIVNLHKEMGWNLLRNEHEVLDIQGQKLGIVGVENWGHSLRFPKTGNLEKAKKGMPDVPVKLLLSHDPSHWEAKVLPEHKDIDAMFAGHTHGAQFGIENRFVKWSPVQYVYKQWAGLYETNNQKLYVNRGFGFIGYPGRVGIMPEITLFELKRGRA